MGVVMRTRWGRLLGCAAAVALGLAGFAAVSPVQGVEAVDLLVPQTTAERHGLTRAWFAQIPGGGGRSHVTHVMQDDGTLFVQTSAAMIFAIDSETGRLLWSQQVGEPGRLTMAAGANGKAAHGSSEDAAIERLLNKTEDSARAISQRRNKVVAVANGTTLYLLNRADGSFYRDPKNLIPWQVSLHGVPEAGCLVTDDMVYVPTAEGQLEAYLIDDSKRSAGFLNSLGQAMAAPIEAGDRIAWATHKGVLQITQPDTLKIRHRLETGGPIDAGLAFYPPKIFAASLDGYLYAINENSGEITWKLTVGSAIRARPVVIRGAVFTTPDDGGMFRAAEADGHQVWFNPSPRHFLAASRTKVYATDAFGHMLVLNAKSGATIDNFPLPQAVQPFLNGETDRVILTSDVGFLQCLHEPELKQPQDYTPPKPEPAKTAPKKLPPAVRPKTPPAKAPAAKPPAPKTPVAKQPAAGDDTLVPKAVVPPKKLTPKKKAPAQ